MAHKLKKLPYKYDALKGISKQVVTWHHDVHHKSYVDGLNTAEKKLADMRKSGDFGPIRGVMQAQSHNASGMVLHNVYWDNLGGDGKADVGLAVVRAIKRDFGSYDAWKKEFAETAKVSRGWAILAWWPEDGKLRNLMVDFHDQFAVWGAIPVLAVDVWEHAYYFDQGPNRGAYLERFFENLDWKRIDAIYKKAAQ